MDGRDTLRADESARRGAIDVARVGALIFVVLGHLMLATIDRGPDGALRGANVLALHPRLAWSAMLAPMPVFFAAAGWANATSTPRSAARRLRTLVGLGAVVVAVWYSAAIVEILLRGEGGIVTGGARVATQPLWFLAAYIPLAALGSRVAWLSRRPIRAIGGALVVLAVLDAARFGLGLPGLIGWPGFWVAWGVPWLLGAWWRHRWEAGGMNEPRTGAILGLGGIAAAWVLVLVAGYRPALIDAVPGARSNTTPPTLFTAVAGVAQVGLLMVLAGHADRLAAARRRLLDQAGEASIAVYVFHLTALVLCAGVLAAGWWAPLRFSSAWWLTRPLWFAAVLATTGVLVSATAWARGRLGHERNGSLPGPRIFVGLICATVGAGLVGLIGPRTLPAALAAISTFGISWWSLRPPASTGRRRRVTRDRAS